MTQARYTQSKYLAAWKAQVAIGKLVYLDLYGSRFGAAELEPPVNHRGASRHPERGRHDSPTAQRMVPLDPTSDARRMVRQAARRSAGGLVKIFMRDIIAEAAEAHNLQVADLTGPSRARHITRARQEAYWRCRYEAQASLPRIAAALGRADHSAVHHGIRRHEQRIAEALA